MYSITILVFNLLLIIYGFSELGLGGEFKAPSPPCQDPFKFCVNHKNRLVKNYYHAYWKRNRLYDLL